MFERYDEMHNRIEMYKHSKAFIFYDLIQAIRNKENNDEYRKQYLLRCKEYIDVFDNNAILFIVICGLLPLICRTIIKLWKKLFLNHIKDIR